MKIEVLIILITSLLGFLAEVVSSARKKKMEMRRINEVELNQQVENSNNENQVRNKNHNTVTKVINKKRIITNVKTPEIAAVEEGERVTIGVIETESHNELEQSQVLREFDLKKAVIYSEILKPKYEDF